MLVPISAAKRNNPPKIIYLDKFLSLVHALWPYNSYAVCGEWWEISGLAGLHS